MKEKSPPAPRLICVECAETKAEADDGTPTIGKTPLAIRDRMMGDRSIDRSIETPSSGRPRSHLFCRFSFYRFCLLKEPRFGSRIQQQPASPARSRRSLVSSQFHSCSTAEFKVQADKSTGGTLLLGIKDRVAYYASCNFCDSPSGLGG